MAYQKPLDGQDYGSGTKGTGQGPGSERSHVVYEYLFALTLWVWAICHRLRIRLFGK